MTSAAHYIDTHTHLYQPAFDTDRQAVLSRAKAEGIQRFYLPAIDSTTHHLMMDLAAADPACHPMMGLHPCSVNENFEAELAQVKHWLGKEKFAAIGEIGLDFYWDLTYQELQYTCFRRQIEMALQWSLPIVIHSRNATAETLSVIGEYAGSGLPGIFHCFGGNAQEAGALIAAGLLLGIGGVVTYKNSGLAQALQGVPLEKIVLETDAPYLAPVPFRGKRNESAYLMQVVHALCTVYGKSPEEIGKQTTANALALFAC